MRGKSTLFIDQYRQMFGARTLRELRAKVGGGRISKMYRDTKEGRKHVGYVVGSHWFEAYRPI